METQYEPIIEIGELIWVGVVYMIHASVLAMHTGLASFLLATGAHQLLAPGADGPWLRKLGFTPGEVPQARRFAFARIGVGVMLLAPFAIGAPMGVSLLAPGHVVHRAVESFVHTLRRIAATAGLKIH